MANHSGILAWRILWTEEPGRLQSTGPQRVNTTEATEDTHIVLMENIIGVSWYSKEKDELSFKKCCLNSLYVDTSLSKIKKKINSMKITFCN